MNQLGRYAPLVPGPRPSTSLASQLFGITLSDYPDRTNCRVEPVGSTLELLPAIVTEQLATAMSGADATTGKIRQLVGGLADLGNRGLASRNRMRCHIVGYSRRIEAVAYE